MQLAACKVLCHCHAAYLSSSTLCMGLILVDFTAGETPARICIVALDEQDLLHAWIQQDATHYWHLALEGFEGLNNPINAALQSVYHTSAMEYTYNKHQTSTTAAGSEASIKTRIRTCATTQLQMLCRLQKYADVSVGSKCNRWCAKHTAYSFSSGQFSNTKTAKSLNP